MRTSTKAELTALAMILAGVPVTALAEEPVKRMKEVSTEGFLCYEGPNNTICADPVEAQSQPQYNWKPSDCGSKYFKDNHDKKPGVCLTKDEAQIAGLNPESGLPQNQYARTGYAGCPGKTGTPTEELCYVVTVPEPKIVEVKVPVVDTPGLDAAAQRIIDDNEGEHKARQEEHNKIQEAVDGLGPRIDALADKRYNHIVVSTDLQGSERRGGPTLGIDGMYLFDLTDILAAGPHVGYRNHGEACYNGNPATTETRLREDPSVLEVNIQTPQNCFRAHEGNLGIYGELKLGELNLLDKGIRLRLGAGLDVVLRSVAEGRVMYGYFERNGKVISGPGEGSANHQGEREFVRGTSANGQFEMALPLGDHWELGGYGKVTVSYDGMPDNQRVTDFGGGLRLRFTHQRGGGK